VSGGSNTPDVHTWTPGLMIRPPMMIGPIVTQMGPTLGGTKVSSVDCGGGDWEAAGAVIALALATGVERPTTAVVAAAVSKLRIRIRGRLPPLRRRTHCPTGRLALPGCRGGGERLVAHHPLLEDVDDTYVRADPAPAAWRAWCASHTFSAARPQSKPSST
jgi:hypothetical protein